MTDPVLRTIDEARYTAWFDANRSDLRYRGPYHDPAWLRAVARGTGFHLGFIGVLDGAELIAAVPGFLAQRGPFHLFGSPLRGTMTSYLGPVALDDRFEGTGQRDLVHACADFARREWHASHTRCTVRDAPPQLLPPLGPGWHEQRPGSYRLDLSPGEDALFRGLKSHCRRNVRKAEREGVEIVSLDDANLFYRILQDTFRRHGTSSWHSARFFNSLMQELPSRGLLWGWGARYREQIIAAGLFLHDENEVHFISGASLQKYGALPTSYQLHWHAIATGAGMGLRTFNSDASGIPSIDQFKETFNPVRERRNTLMWSPPSIQIAQRAFRSWSRNIRRLRSKIPVR